MKRNKSFYLIVWCIIGFLFWVAITVALIMVRERMISN